ncbi:NADP-dependent oxidoreductase [Leifsonia sp. F6_8S_P_1B]|uniref:NADP-dependent oxidoreductase n=1 Tax=Leifsonia williamsii TaxID=3035919 RepID=A0ABT8K8P1_9MICO|nr:NADP-dependent oxidoreductase [Leifsonia williamsii]MDN4613824.1 NADP-dependent oxidoreductase [Leifsonia williamsii]
MKAITVSDRAAGAAGLRLDELPEPHAAENDVVVQVRAAGFTPGELAWPATWTDRSGRDRTPTVPGHELAGVVTALGYGTTGLTVGQRVFGFADWARNGTLAEYVAVETRNLAPLPADIDFVTAASLPISGLTAWQGLFEHGRLQAGQTVLVDGVAGGVGTIVAQLAREAGAVVVGAGRGSHRERALEAGAHLFVDTEGDWSAVEGGVDLVFDVIGGDVGARSADRLRAGGRLVTIVEPPQLARTDVDAVFFVVEPDRAQLVEIARRVRSGALRPFVGDVVPLEEAAAAFGARAAGRGKTIVRVGD